MSERLRERVEEIRARADAATRGPWIQDPDTAVGKVWVNMGFMGRRVEPLFNVQNGYQRGVKVREMAPQREKDAAFVANAREDIPWLCEKLLALLEAD